MAGPHDDKIGELTPGASGWLPLDAAGLPSGPATLLPPSPGPDTFAAHVYAVVDPLVGYDALLTMSGAPLTDAMNSVVDNRMTFTYPAAKQGG